MKKAIALTALLTLSTAAFAGFNDHADQKGGFQDNGQYQVNTVAQALKAKDDTPVTLTGNIVKRANDHDEFIFRDKTGEILIEVDDNAWNGQNVDSNDTITIEGKVDTNRHKPSEVDVYRITKH